MIQMKMSGESGGGGGAFSALRAFRLMRVFKLAKSSESLSMLLESIARTLGAMANFSILLFLVIYIFSLLGMTAFAGQINLDDDGNLIVDKYGEANR